AQVNSKGGAIEAYGLKMQALQRQVQALQQGYLQKKAQVENKLKQVQLKQASTEAALEQAKVDEAIALLQYNRVDSLYLKGLKSRTDMELKQLKYQETKAKLVANTNKLQEAQSEVQIVQLELQNLENSYAEKIAKAESDLYSTASLQYEGEVQKLKLEVSLENYRRRNNYYYILAPQDCYITKAIKPGIGETVKAGDPIVTVMPADFELAVELYVSPMDLPLVVKEQEVRFIFDGWPAFVFAGWPQLSTGIFTGEIVAVDNTISENGRYRILAAPKAGAKSWPAGLRVGTGAQSIALLNTVPVWYEIWRRLNGFPPDYYNNAGGELPKMKIPLKSVSK
ncbi:MAG: HlyD family efflux transporter periplasmic adaptor subunit, partial [Phaeodactylibacter sp.]|nr:HlyD family efflux transporter periplasmic adaptor subunit [Phaeodactylibacter sp.]